MGISGLPSTVSTKWVEIASNSPTSGNSITFSSIPEYNNYKLTCIGLTSSASGNLLLRFNGDTGSNYIVTGLGNSGSSASVTGTTTTSLTIIDAGIGNGGTAEIYILGGNQPTKQINYWSRATNPYFNANALWNSTSTITSMDFLWSFSATFTGGTFRLYGKN